MTLPPLTLSEPSPWIRRPWCRWLAIALVLAGAALNLHYLWYNCPLSLSEDESHYWEWSRHLDYGYYSKPPAIAWLFAATTQIGRLLGMPQATMLLLRTPAILFSVCTGFLSIALARRLFRDDRTALCVTLLSAFVPMFVVGSLLLTIDSPMFLAWALATYALWRYVDPLENPRLAWLYLAALATGLGMLFKPLLIALPICLALAAWTSPTLRRRLGNIHTLVALLLTFLLQSPIIIWNAQHHWVTFRHISAQGGFTGRPVSHSPLAMLTRLGTYIGGQAGGMGGILFVLLIIALLTAWRELQGFSVAIPPAPAETRRHVVLKFLLTFTLPLWLFYALLSLWKDTEPNWPAASYFTGMLLLANIATLHWNSPNRAARRQWKIALTFAAIIGLSAATLIEHLEWLYPLMAPNPSHPRSLLNPAQWDKKLRGFRERAEVVNAAFQQFQNESPTTPLLIATDRYDTSSSLSFYLPNQPFVYCLMKDVGSRMSQYDLWPGLNERRNGALVHGGANVLLIGAFGGSNPDDPLNKIIKPAFDHISPLQWLRVYHDGRHIMDVATWHCYGFKGLPETTNKNY